MINRRDFLKVMGFTGLVCLGLERNVLALEQILSTPETQNNLDPRYNFSKEDLSKYKSWIEKTMTESEERKSFAVIVDKAAYSLDIIKDGKVTSQYPIELGTNPYDDKQIQGDRCTPEGMFYICKKNPNSQFYKSLGISYPNFEHAEKGLKHGLITKKQAEQIRTAIEKKVIPPQNTLLGNDIYIHGGGTGRAANDGGQNWTWGCIAVSNKEIDEIYKTIDVRTPVTIVKYGVFPLVQSF